MAYVNKKDPDMIIFVYEQAKELVYQGHEVYIVTKKTDSSASYEVKSGIRIYRQSTNYQMLRRIFTLDKKINFDIFHSHFIDLSTLLGGIASTILNKRLVVTSHGLDVLTGGFISDIFKRFLFMFPKKVMCVSKNTANLASRFTSKNKLVLVYNGVDIDKLKPTKTIKQFKKEKNLDGKIILLSVGALIERKGFDLIINALPDVVKKFPNLIYVIVGRGTEFNKLKKLTKYLGISKNVIFYNYFLTDEEIANFYNIADIFILMSRTSKKEIEFGIEGFGIAYIEASFFGVPVIGGKSGGTADAVIDGKTGFLITPGNQKELIDKLLLLLQNKKQRKKMGKAGKEFVLNRRLWKQNVQKTLKIYKGIMKNNFQ
tara:strand:- start:1317 stop:2432 length:1116 start_codon:yes stop_codon:yes gene_type:complete